MYYILQQRSGNLMFVADGEALKRLLLALRAHMQMTNVHDVTNYASKVLAIVAAWRIDPIQREQLTTPRVQSAVFDLVDHLLRCIRAALPEPDKHGFALCRALLLRAALTPINEQTQHTQIVRPGLRRVMGSPFAAETAALATATQAYVTHPVVVLVYEEVIWCLSQQVYPSADATLARIIHGRDTQSFLFGEVAVLLWLLQATHDLAWPDESLESLESLAFGTNTVPSSYATRIVPPIAIEHSEGFIGAVGLFEPDAKLRSYTNIPL